MKKENLTLIFVALFLLFISVETWAQNVEESHDHSNPAPVQDEYSEDQLRNTMRSEGIPEATIEVLIRERKEFHSKGIRVERVSMNMDRRGNSASIKKNNLPKPYAICSDMGGENGWGAWQAESGLYGAGGPANGSNSATNPYNGVLSLSSSGIIAPRFNLTSGTGIDPCTPGPGGVPVPVVCPGFGNASIQLGEPRNNGIKGGCGQPSMFGTYNNGCAEQLTYVLNVTPQDTNFMWASAFFIDEPDMNGNPHNPGNTPYAGMCIYDSSGASIPCGCFKFDQGSAANGYTQAICSSVSSTPGVVWYKPWSVSGINLSKYIGQALTIVLTNVDCAWGGHFAYSYWDFQCQTPPTTLTFCPGQSISLCANPPIPGNNYNYQWYINGVPYTGAPSGTAQCITPIPQPGDTFMVSIQQGSGCNLSMLYTVQLSNITPGFIYSGTCGQMTFTDQSVSSNSTVPVSVWNWQFPGGTPAASNSQNPGIVHYPPGTYTVTLIVSTSQGCPDTITQVITVGGFPTAAFLPTTPCLGGNTQLNDGSVSNPGDPIVSWNWQMPAGSPASATSTNTSTMYNTAGTHTVSLVVTTQQGCKDTIIQQVLVYNPPIANFTGPAKGCAPVCNNYTDISTSTDGNIVSWQWNFPGGSYTTSNAQNPQNVCYNTPGTFGASLIIVSSYGCKDTISLPAVEVYPWPKADFCVAPTKAPITNPVFTFCDMWSSDVVQWSWDFGDSDTDNVSTDPIHSYSATAFANDWYTYNICIRVQNQYGCWDTICKPVELVPEFTFYIPNTFTPNGDWINEYFYGKSRGVKEYNIWLFDRWGNQIWDCHHEDKNTNWDNDNTVPKQEGLSSFCQWDGVVVKGGMDMGGNSRQLAQEDVYVWKVKLTDIFDKQHSYIGHVNIVR